MPSLSPFFVESAAPAARPVLTTAQAASVARELTQALDVIFGARSAQYDPALDLPRLTDDLAAVLASPAAPSEAADQANALTLFQRPLVARHALAPSTWTLLLDRVASHPGLARHPCAVIAPQLVAALPRLPYLRAVTAHFDATSSDEKSAPLESLLSLHALLTADGSSDLALMLSASFAPSPALVGVNLDALEASLVAHLRTTLEQTEIDEAVSAVAWLRRLAAAPGALDGADALKDSAIRAALAPTGVSALVLFRLHLIGRHRIVQAAACETLLAKGPSLANELPELFAAARPAIRGLSTISRDLAAWPDDLLADLAKKDHVFVASILVAEHRLRRPASARVQAFRRIAEDFSRETGTPLSALGDTLSALAVQPAWRTAEPAAALEALRDALPSLEAATLLLARHAEIGTDTARRAYAIQPAYAVQTGSAGEKAYAKDNALTLRQLALYLLDCQPRTSERLQAWWNAIVGIHIANRPDHLFVHNLRCLHAALRAVLPAAALDLVFAHVHQLYKEAIGTPDSPLLHFGAYDLPLLETKTAYAPLSGDSQKAHLKRVAALVGAPQAFASAWLSWLAAPDESTLPSLVTAHGAEPVPRALALLLGDVVRDQGIDHPSARRVAALPARLAVNLFARHIDQPHAAAEDKFLCDLALTHTYLAEQLRIRPLDHAVLQATRFLIELVGPYLVEGAAAWERDILAAHASLERDCPALARPLLDRWTAHLRALGPRLVELRPFLQLAFPAGHPSLAASIGEEKHLRGALTAALLPHLLPAGSPWSGASLRAILPAANQADTTRLIAFLDTLFDQLDGACYYELLAVFSDTSTSPVVALPASDAPRRPGAVLAVALATPPPKKGLLSSLFGPPPEHLAHDLALASNLAPDWLAPLLLDFVPEPVRPLAATQALAWSALAS